MLKSVFKLRHGCGILLHIVSSNWFLLFSNLIKPKNYLSQPFIKIGIHSAGKPWVWHSSDATKCFSGVKWPKEQKRVSTNSAEKAK